MSDAGGLGTRFGMALMKCCHNFCLLRKTIIFFRPRVIRNRSIKNNSDRMCDIIAQSHKKKASYFFRNLLFWSMVTWSKSTGGSVND